MPGIFDPGPHFSLQSVPYGATWRTPGPGDRPAGSAAGSDRAATSLASPPAPAGAVGQASPHGAALAGTGGTDPAVTKYHPKKRLFERRSWPRVCRWLSEPRIATAASLTGWDSCRAYSRSITGLRSCGEHLPASPGAALGWRRRRCRPKIHTPGGGPNHAPAETHRSGRSVPKTVRRSILSERVDRVASRYVRLPYRS